jgi:hypothetical protein
LYINKLDNFDEMDKFLEKQKLPKQTQEERGYLNGLIESKQIDLANKKLSMKKSPGSDGFTSEFYQKSKQKLSAFYKLFPKEKRRKYFPIHSLCSNA